MPTTTDSAPQGHQAATAATGATRMEMHSRFWFCKREDYDPHTKALFSGLATAEWEQCYLCHRAEMKIYIYMYVMPTTTSEQQSGESAHCWSWLEAQSSTAVIPNITLLRPGKEGRSVDSGS